MARQAAQHGPRRRRAAARHRHHDDDAGPPAARPPGHRDDREPGRRGRPARRRPGRAGGPRRRRCDAPTSPWSACSPRTRSAQVARRPRLPRRERGPRRRAGPRHHRRSRCRSSAPSSPPPTRWCCWPTGTSSPGPGHCGCAPCTDIDVLVTNDGADPDTLEACAAAGVEVLHRVRLAILGGGGLPRPPRVRRAAARHQRAAGSTEVVAARRGRGPARRGRARARRRWRRATSRPPRGRDDHRPRHGARAAPTSSSRRSGSAAWPGAPHDERVALDLGRARAGDDRPGRPGLRAAHRAGRASTSPSASRALAPDAWVINFTNPAGMITEAMQWVLGDRVVGICDSPIGLAPPGRPARSGSTRTARRLDYVGLNHLGWLRGPARRRRRRAAAACSPTTPLLAAIEEGRAVRRRTGCAPSARCPTSTSTTTTSPATRSPRSAAAPQTRGEFLLDQQRGFYDAVAARPRAAPSASGDRVRARARRDVHAGGRGTHDGRGARRRPTSRAAATRAWRSRSWRRSPATSGRAMILNVRNGATPAGAAAPTRSSRCPCTVDADGPHPLAARAARRAPARPGAAGQGRRAARPSRRR